MTKLSLNNLTYDGGSIPESATGLQDQLQDLVKTCRKDKVKVALPTSPTPYSELVIALRDKGILASNDLSEPEDSAEVSEFEAQHKAEVRFRHHIIPHFPLGHLNITCIQSLHLVP